jgi:peptidoglycan/LPS O-acetylase OafA/YrhL
VFPYSWFRLDGLATGAWIGCFVRSPQYSTRKARRLAVILAGVGILLEIAGSPFGIRQHHTALGAALEFPPIDMIAAALVLWGAAFSGRSQTRILRARFLGLSGDLSYCLYLSHCMVMDGYDAALRALHHAPAVAGFRGVLLRAGVVLMASFAIAAVSRVVLEHPALRAKRFFQPAKPGRRAAAVSK